MKWAFIFLATLPVLALGHGYIYWPRCREIRRKERNPQDSNSYSPSAWSFRDQLFPRTVESKWGAGDGGAEAQPKARPSDFSGFLCNKIPEWTTVTTYKEGGPIQIVIVMNAEHGGHHDFRLCPKKWSDLKSPKEQAECLDMYLLGGKNGHVCSPQKECGCHSDGCKGTNGWRSPSDPIYAHGKPEAMVHGANVYNFTLPKGVYCDHCTLQWFWHTSRNGEQFANCADIKIEKDPNSPPAPSPGRRRGSPPAPSPETPSPGRRRGTPSPGRRRGDPCPPGQRRRAKSCPPLARRRSPTRRRSQRRRKGSSRRRKGGSSRRRSSARRRGGSRRRSGSMAAANSGHDNMEVEELGCMPDADDSKISTLRDVECTRGRTQPTMEVQPCRGGLPFYRYSIKVNDQPPPVDQCFRFCTSKGMDLFGLANDESECRCGASEDNSVVWGDSWFLNAYKRGLAFNWSLLHPVRSTCSGVRIFRYHEWLEVPGSKGVPAAMLQRTNEDEHYVSSMINRGPALAPWAR